MPASSRSVRAEADAEDGNSAQTSKQHAAARPRRNAVTDMKISWEPGAGPRPRVRCSAHSVAVLRPVARPARWAATYWAVPANHDQSRRSLFEILQQRV